MDYPVCDSCGATMNIFDGWAWYTCPNCGNAVRILDGVVTWQRDIFYNKKKRRDIEPEEWQDFEDGWRPDDWE